MTGASGVGQSRPGDLSEPLPLRIVGILMLAPFAFATGAYVFAGLLEPMAADFGVSVAAAAQLQTAFAIACAIGGPILAIGTARLDRRRTLVCVLLLLTLANAVSALTTSFPMLVAVRIAAGFIGALALPVASAIAVMAVAPQRRPAALAAIIGGTTLAFLIGIPLGSVIGGRYGWPASFWFASGLCFAVAALVAAFISRSAAPPAPPPGAIRAVLRWPATGLLAITLAGFTATFATVGLIGPVVTRLTGLTGAGIGPMQALVGVGGLFGLALGARLAARRGRPFLRLMGGILGAQALFSIGMGTGIAGIGGIILCAMGIFFGSVCLFAIAPIVQIRLAAIAGPAAAIAFAFNGSMIFLGQGLGTALGGAVTSTTDLWAVGVAGSAIACLGLMLAGSNPGGQR